MKKFFLIFIIVTVTLSSLRYVHRAPKRKYSDFHVLYTTSERFIRGEDIYTFQGGVSYFKYTPFYAFLVSPLGFLSEFKAALLWHFINWGFIFVTFICWIKILKIKRKILISVFSFIFCFRFILENLDQGQANISFLAFTSISLYFYFRQRQSFAAGFLSVSILSKYLSLLFLPLFLFKKEYKFILKIIFFLILLYFSPLFFTGFEKMLQLFSQNINFLFKSSLDNYSITCYPNQSLLAFLRRLFSINEWYPNQIYPLTDRFISGLFLFLGLGFTFLSCFLKNNFKVNIGLISTLIPLLNPNGWKNSFIWLLIPAMILIQEIFENKNRDKLLLTMLVLAFLFTALTSEFFVYAWAGDWFEIHSFITWGAIIMYLGFLRLYKLSISK